MLAISASRDASKRRRALGAGSWRATDRSENRRAEAIARWRFRPPRAVPSRPMTDPPGLPSALGIEAVEWFAQEGGGENLTVRVTGQMAPASARLDRTADARRRGPRLPAPVSGDAGAAEPDRHRARHLADDLLGSGVDRAAPRYAGVAATRRGRDPAARAARARVALRPRSLIRMYAGERGSENLELTRAGRESACARGRGIRGELAVRVPGA